MGDLRKQGSPTSRDVFFFCCFFTRDFRAELTRLGDGSFLPQVPFLIGNILCVVYWWSPFVAPYDILQCCDTVTAIPLIARHLSSGHCIQSKWLYPCTYPPCYFHLHRYIDAPFCNTSRDACAISHKSELQVSRNMKSVAAGHLNSMIPGSILGRLPCSGAQGKKWERKNHHVMQLRVEKFSPKFSSAENH